MDLDVIKISEIDDKLKKKADLWIKSEDTNGEFINTLEYLSYHPQGRFQDDSIIVIDKGSGNIKGIMMAATQDQNSCIISHPGTTFAGPILSRKEKVSSLNLCLDCIFSYYEKKYKEIQIKLRPSIYDSQPMEFIHYYLLKHNYRFGMMALANIIDLKKVDTVEKLFNLYTSKRRNNVNKALKNKQYHIEKLSNINKEIWEQINLNLDSKYNAHTTHSFEEINKLYQMFPNEIEAHVALRDDKTYGAFMLAFKYKNVFHTQYLDVNYNVASECPHIFLLHDMFLEARKQGFFYFSFGASTEERGEYLNQGLYNYKQEYGGGSIILPVYTKCRID